MKGGDRRRGSRLGVAWRGEARHGLARSVVRLGAVRQGGARQGKGVIGTEKAMPALGGHAAKVETFAGIK